jgi:uncharacterized membrane protein
MSSEGWAWVIRGPKDTPVDHVVYFSNEIAAQASAWRRRLDRSAGYSVVEVPYHEQEQA